MAYTSARGCFGYVKTDSVVFCTKSNSDRKKSKYIINHVFLEDEKITIGINPMLANPIVKQLLLSNKLPLFKNIKNLKQEITIDKSIFDFTFEMKGNKKAVLEVKNVSFADVVDVDEKIRKKMDISKYDLNEKIAIFTNGYRMNSKGSTSERAVKQTNHLAQIAKKTKVKLFAQLYF